MRTIFCNTREWERNLKTYNGNDNHIIDDLLRGIRVLDEIIIARDNQTLTKTLNQSRDALCDEFSTICKDVKIKKGVKHINNRIKYYCNGLVEVRSGKNQGYIEPNPMFNYDLYVKPFEYVFETTNPIKKPIYKQMFRDGDHQYIRKNGNLNLLPRTASWLINDYLKSCVGKKPSQHKVNYHMIKQQIQKLNDTFPEQLSKQNREIMSYTIDKELSLHKEFVKDYIKALNYCLNGRYIKGEYDSAQHYNACCDLYQCTDLGSDQKTYDPIAAPIEFLPNPIFANKNAIVQHPSILRFATYYSGTNNSRIDRSQLPYLDESDVKQFLEIYQKTFDGYAVVEDGNIVKNAENLAKDDVYEFYVKHYKTQEIKQPNLFYENHGYLSLLFDYGTHNHETICTATVIRSEGLYDGPQQELKSSNEYGFYNKIHQEIIKSAKTMLVNIDLLINEIESIPNENMQAFMKQNNII